MTAYDGTGLPQVTGRPMVADGGIETDLLFHRGFDLPEFAAFPLLDSADGRAAMRDYFDDYALIAERAAAGLVLDTPTWRASSDWGERLGYGPADLARVNRDAVAFARELRGRFDAVSDVVISGAIGPRGDAYRADLGMAAEAARAYHAPQVRALVDAGVDLISTYTFTEVGEAIGVVLAAREAGVPVAIGFTVETDGRLPSGTPLDDAIRQVDDAAAPDYFLVNCAHPVHVAPALEAPGRWRERILGYRANASQLSHAELDESTELDEGDPAQLSAEHRALRPLLPNLTVVGGCCGTDSRHVAALWDVDLTEHSATP